MCAVLQTCPATKSNQHVSGPEGKSGQWLQLQEHCGGVPGEVGRSMSHWCEYPEGVSSVESLSWQIGSLEKDLSSQYFKVPLE